MSETLLCGLSKRDKTILEALNGKAANLFFIDGHKHDFRAASGTPNCVILRFLLRPHVSKVVAALLSNLDPLTDKDLGNRLANYLSRSNQPSRKILSDWKGLYQPYCRQTAKEVAGASLVIDMETPFQHLVQDAGHKTVYSFREQLKEILDLARQMENLGRVLPFVGIDPRREDLLDILTFAFANGCIGGKVYPSLGFLPSHPRLMPVWSAFEQSAIPIIVHCSNIGIFSFETRLRIDGQLYDPKTNTTMNVDEDWIFWPWGCRVLQVRPWIYLNDPIHWRPVLEEFPNLKLCFAHVGGKKEIENHMKGKPSWTSTILSYIDNEKYSQVYTDLSFVSRYHLINQYFLNLAKSSERFRQRLILGTDFPLDELLTEAQSAVDGMLKDFAEYLPILGIRNFLRFINP
jgi:predicted TIM-barrel fold metal-dependent hydrolase